VYACFRCVRFSLFSMPSDEIGSGKRLRGPILCRVGCKTTTESILVTGVETVCVVASLYCLQCIDAVGWAAGRASGL